MYLKLIEDLRMKMCGDDGGDDPGKTKVPQDDPDNKNGNGDDDPGKKPPGDDPNKNNGDDDDKLDFDSLDPKTQKYIKSLRNENKERRTEFNKMSARMETFEKGLKKLFGGEDDDTGSPEEKLEAASSQLNSSVTENIILKLALSNGITGEENVEYFQFLMNKKLESLEEGEEVSDEDVEEIISK